MSCVSFLFQSFSSNYFQFLSSFSLIHVFLEGVQVFLVKTFVSDFRGGLAKPGSAPGILVLTGD